jgi:hypothetical protein
VLPVAAFSALFGGIDFLTETAVTHLETTSNNRFFSIHFLARSNNEI